LSNTFVENPEKVGLFTGNVCGVLRMDWDHKDIAIREDRNTKGWGREQAGPDFFSLMNYKSVSGQRHYYNSRRI